MTLSSASIRTKWSSEKAGGQARSLYLGCRKAILLSQNNKQIILPISITLKINKSALSRHKKTCLPLAPVAMVKLNASGKVLFSINSKKSNAIAVATTGTKPIKKLKSNTLSISK